MLIHKKTIVMGVIFLLAAGVWAASAETLLDQNSVLAGRVLEQNLAKAGTPVKEGTVLVCVESITGSAVAARATKDGVVAQVLVKPGDVIAAGQAVVRIQPTVK